MARVIADNFGCYNYFRTRRTHTIVFFGGEEDVMVCNIVMEFAVDCIESAVKRLRYQYIKDGFSTRGLENDYAMGFIEGLQGKYEEQKANHQEWGLVLVKDAEFIEAYKKIKLAKTIDTIMQYQGYPAAYKAGYKVFGGH